MGIQHCNVCGNRLLAPIPVTKKEYFNIGARGNAGGDWANKKFYLVIAILVMIIIAMLLIPRNNVSTVSDADSQGVAKSYNWSFDDTNYIWQPSIPSNLLKWDEQVENTVITFYSCDRFNQFVMRCRLPANIRALAMSYSVNSTDNGAAWVTEQQNYDFSTKVAAVLNAMVVDKHLDDIQRVEYFQSFVGGAVPYVNSTAYQLPADTLVNGGNCIAKSILLAAMLKSLGYKVALICFPNEDHVAIGVDVDMSTYFTGYDKVSFTANGIRYYFLETTEPGWGLGQLSRDSLRDPQVYVIN